MMLLEQTSCAKDQRWEGTGVIREEKEIKYGWNVSGTRLRPGREAGPGQSGLCRPRNECRERRRCGFDPWLGKIPWRRKWRPTPVSLPGSPMNRGGSGGLNSTGVAESDTTK